MPIMGKIAKDDPRFQAMLDMADPGFGEALINALGLKPGDTVAIRGPQFKRTDGQVVAYLPNTPEEYEALHILSPENLKKIGCQVWGRVGRRTHWLFPGEWYRHIPAGTDIVTISGRREKFEPGVTGNGIRHGALAYGFIQEADHG